MRASMCADGTTFRPRHTSGPAGTEDLHSRERTGKGLIRNCLKYAQQCQNGTFKKTCSATTVPYSIMWISPRLYVHIGSMGNPLIPDAEKTSFTALLLAEFKNRYMYVNATIIL